MPKQHISIRLNVSPSLYEQICGFRHERRFETKAQALTCILNAGLAALAKPPVMPTSPQPRKPIPFAGAEQRHRTNA